MGLLAMKTTDELIKIAAAGGGFVLEAGKRTTDELASIAAAARRSGAAVIFRNVAIRKTDALVKIAGAGKGHVIFES
jgi:DNA replication protein